jgi:hypothetical protein
LFCGFGFLIRGAMKAFHRHRYEGIAASEWRRLHRREKCDAAITAGSEMRPRRPNGTIPDFKRTRHELAI